MTPLEPRRGRAVRSVKALQGPQLRGESRDGRSDLWADMDTGWIMVAELIAATLVWGGIGWLFDRWLGTAPWLMSIGFVIGNATGMYLAWLRYTRSDADADNQHAR